jgi:glycosyltransferase involved in cell wall biosynthesis
MPARRRLLIASQPLSAGVPRHVLDLVEGLVGSDWEITVACPPTSTLWQPLAKRQEVALHAFTAARRPAASDAASLARLLRLVRTVDVIHVHSAKAGFLGRLAARLRGRAGAAVYTPHAWSFWAAGGAEQRLYRALERRAARWCRAIVAVSEHEREAGLDAGIGRVEQYRVIPNGVDPGRFSGPPEPVAGRVLFLGRLGPQKRPELAVQALARVRGRFPGAELHLASDGPDRETLVELAARLGLSGAVRFLGYRDDVPALLSRASCMLVTSDYEGAPYTVLEAMAAGVPVVATRVGGVPEAVVDGETGLLVSPGDAAALADRLARLLADPDAAARMGAAGRRIVQERFTRQHMVARTLALYEEVAR